MQIPNINIKETISNATVKASDAFKQAGKYAVDACTKTGEGAVELTKGAGALIDTFTDKDFTGTVKNNAKTVYNKLPDALKGLAVTIKNNKYTKTVLGGAILVGATALAISCVKNIVNKIKEKVQEK